MAIRLMSQVWDLRLPDSEKLVLLALADAANDEGVCWPSIATIARKCTRSERTIQSVIKKLVEDGHLSRDERPGRGVFYTIHPRSDCAPASTTPPQPDTPPPATVAPHPRNGCGGPPQRLHPNRKEPSLNHQRSVESDTPPPRRVMPEDWKPSAAELSFVAQQTAFNPWPPDKLERVIHEFVAYYRSKGTLSADWGADFRRWVLKQPRFEQHDNAGPDESGYTDPFLQACAREVRAGRLSRGG